MESQNVLVSIVIPVFNSSSYLDRCLNSVLNQTYKCIEVILVDDGSTDDSWEICKKYQCKDTRIKVHHTENKGVSSARNYGLQNCSGKWVYFVDSDDWINEKAIESLLDSEMDSLCLYLHQAKTIDAYNSRNKMWPYQYQDCIIEVSQVSDCDMLDKVLVYGTPWGKLYNTEIIRKNNIRFDEYLSFHEDHCFFLNYISKIERIKIISVPQYYYWIDTKRNTLSQKGKIHDPNKLLYSADVMSSYYNRIIRSYKLNRRSFARFNTFLLGIRLSALRNAIKSNRTFQETRTIYHRINRKSIKMDYRPATKMGRIMKQIVLLPNFFLMYWLLKIINLTTNRL